MEYLDYFVTSYADTTIGSVEFNIMPPIDTGILDSLLSAAKKGVNHLKIEKNMPIASDLILIPSIVL